MRVGMYYTNSDVRVEKMPKPEIRSKEVLVKVHASGICGSDVMEWYRVKTAPRVLGHEIAAEIVECGTEVTRFKNGDRVFVSHHVPCNTCRHCLNGFTTACDTLSSTNFDPGGFAEYIRIPEINVDRGIFLLPDEMSYDEGTFIEPVACAFRGQRMTGVKPGGSILVVGSGISGIIHIQLARALGAGKIFAADISTPRLEAAKKLGADVVIDAKEDFGTIIAKHNNNRLVDLAILCTGVPKAIENTIKAVERGGNVLFFAPTDPGVTIPIDINYIWKKGITLKTSYGAGPEDIAPSIDLMASKRLELSGMITHKFPLNDIGQGFNLVAEGGKSLKVIIEPNR